MRTFCVAIFVFLLCSTVYCQQQYLPGYIVTNNGDTMHVTLQEGSMRDITQTIKFKKDLQSAASTFKPGDISSFGYDKGGLYKSVLFSGNPSDSTDVKYYFAEQLLAGTYDLFLYQRKDHPAYIVRKDNHYYVLTNTTYTGRGEIDDTGNYQNQLVFLSVNCGITIRDIEAVGFDDKSMIKIITELNHCANPSAKVISYDHPRNTKFEIIAFAGAFPAVQSFQLAAEVIARFPYPKISRNLYINVGIHFSSTPSLYNKPNSYYFLKNAKTSDMIYSLAATMQYNFIRGIIQPYIAAGGLMGVQNETVNTASFGKFHFDNGFKLSAIGEAGIEATVVRKLLIKAAWRYEAMVEYPVIGIAYKFK